MNGSNQFIDQFRYDVAKPDVHRIGVSACVPCERHLKVRGC